MLKKLNCLQPYYFMFSDILLTHKNTLHTLGQHSVTQCGCQVTGKLKTVIYIYYTYSLGTNPNLVGFQFLSVKIKIRTSPRRNQNGDLGAILMSFRQTEMQRVCHSQSKLINCFTYSDRGIPSNNRHEPYLVGCVWP